MKKIISVILLSVLLIGAMLCFVGCKKIEKGTYVSTDGNIVEISGKNFVYTVGDTTYECTYKIKKDEDDPNRQKIYITFEDGETVDFYYTKHEDGFEFAGQKYTKK